MSLSIGLFLFAFALSFSLSLFFIYRSLNCPHPKRRRIGDGGGVLGAKGGDFTRTESDPSLVSRSLSKLIEENGTRSESEPTHLARAVLLEEEDRSVGGRVRKKRRRAKKKSKEGSGGGGGGEGGSGSGSGWGKPELMCLYPFTSTSSATQRKIKQQYDQLVKCNETKGLTLAQVGEFANCLIEARNELQHKSEVIKRKFTIAKALLFKADRSSIERLRQQIYKLESEQKRLEEDAFVYNWLQQQLKLSPAYKKMVEISSCLELKTKSHDLRENDDPDTCDISFEELLAQEKKDSFWQKNAKSRTYSS